MDPAQFANLYVNANSLSELALRTAVEDIEELLTDSSEAVPVPTLADLEAHLAAEFENLDFSALDDLDLGGDVDSEETDSKETDSKETNSEETNSRSDSTRKETSPNGEQDSELDLEQYMRRAYEHQARLSQRINDAFARADVDQLTRLLRQMPAELSSLTGRLSGLQMDGWLALYKTNFSPLDELVVAIRRLDP